MAKPFALITKALANTKARLMIIIFGVVIVVAGIAIVVHIIRGPDMVQGAAQVASIPQGIQSVPGVNQQNDQYLQILLQSNQQAAKTAMQSGQTEIPSLLATPANSESANFNAQGVAATGQPCCCQPNNASQLNDAGGVISSLENAGKISPVLAGQLRALQAEGLTPAQYEQQLQNLVSQGKLTPAEAQQLLDAYKQNAANSGAQQLGSPDDMVDQFGADGDITPATAASLKALNAQNLSPQDYLAKLNDLVKNGKLSPANAQKLAAAYAASRGGSAVTPPTMTPDALVGQLADSGAISPATAQALKALNAQGLSPAAYMSALNAMVKNGQLTPAQARRLMAAYQQQQQYAQSAAPADVVGQLLSSGGISPATAQTLNTLNNQGLTPAEYDAQLQKLVAEGKLTPEQANLLMKAYANQHPGSGGAPTSGLAALAQAQAANAASQQEQALTQQQTQLQQAAANEAQQQTDAMQSVIAGQASKLFDAWNPSTQRLTGDFSDQAEVEKIKAQAEAEAKAAAAASTLRSPPVIKAGSVMFAVLDTAIDSDQPGPVMATIVSGKFTGAKLLGGLTTTPDKQAVILSFTKMSLPDWTSAATITAVAIDPQTARTALADNVDNHYLLRYGSMFASSFMQGIGQAIQQSGQTQVNNAGTNTTTYSNLNLGEKIMVGLGQVGQNLGSAAQKNFNTPPTVTVSSGQSVGILFEDDVTVPVAAADAVADNTSPVSNIMAPIAGAQNNTSYQQTNSNFQSSSTQ